MRYALIALSILFGSATTAVAQVSIGISVPGVSIGINLPLYPELVPVPGYPVYYAPRVNSNFFFYDGLYWVYQDDNWYASSWYNGPWEFVSPDYVPLFVLRVPVRYYVNPPVYFHGWYLEAPPRWGDHWGHRWAQHRRGWDRWDRRAIYAPAPLPVYQRHYSGDRYPRAEHQRVIRNEHYRYQPRDAVVRQHDQERATPRAQAPAQSIPQGRPEVPRAQRPQREDVQRPVPPQAVPQQRGPAVQEQRQQPRQEADRRAQAPAQSVPQDRPEVPRAQRPQREDVQRPVPPQVFPQQRGPAVQEPPPRQETGPRAQRAPRAQDQERGAQGRDDTPQPRGNAERRQGRERGQERGQQERGNDRGYGRG